MLDLNPIGVPQSRHEGRLSGKGTLEKKAIISTDKDSFCKAHYEVVLPSEVILH